MAWKNFGANGVQISDDVPAKYRINGGSQGFVEFPSIEKLEEYLNEKANINQTITTLNTFSDLANYTGSSETVQVKDLFRGGFFDLYTGGDIVDNGIIFSGSGGAKWKRKIESSEILLQWWGVDGTGTNDNTLNVNRALDFCALNAYRYLNITGTIKITNRLNDSKNKVLFTGNGVLNNTYKNNYAEADISNSEITFTGRVNKSGKLSKTINLLAKNQALKILVFGNSIAYGRDYNTQTPDGSFFEIVNNETNENSWYGNFLRQLQKRFSDKNITIANRAIPGYAISDYTTVVSSLPGPNQPSWLTGGMAGKTWEQIMEDDAPDVIIIEHGMNSASDFAEYAVQFYNAMQSWAKIPEVIWMSTPTLNYINLLTVDWAGLPRLQKLDVANQQYTLSNFYKDYIIDVARVANIQRYGNDFRNFTFKPRSIEGFSFANGADIITGGNLGLPNNGIITVNRHSQTPKFYLSFGFNPSSTFTNFRIKVGDSYAIFSPTSVTVYPYTTVGNVLPPATGSYTFTTGAVSNLKIEFGDFLNVYVDNKLIVTSKVSSPVVNVVDDIVIDLTGSTGVSEISTFQYYEAEFTKYKPTLTGTDIWGEAGFGTNGNAINHPSLLGVSASYNVAVNEFIEDLYSLSNNLKDNQDLEETLTKGNASDLGLDIPYAIFRNSLRAYSLENNASDIGMVDLTAGAFRWMLKANGDFTVANNSGAPTAVVRNSDLANLETKEFVLIASGTGAATTISIPHFYDDVDSSWSVIVSPNNSTSAGISYVTIDATNVNIIYTVAPSAGTSNLKYSVSIKQQPL